MRLRSLRLGVVALHRQFLSPRSLTTKLQIGPHDKPSTPLSPRDFYRQSRWDELHNWMADSFGEIPSTNDFIRIKGDGPSKKGQLSSWPEEKLKAPLLGNGTRLRHLLVLHADLVDDALIVRRGARNVFGSLLLLLCIDSSGKLQTAVIRNAYLHCISKSSRHLSLQGVLDSRLGIGNRARRRILRR